MIYLDAAATVPTSTVVQDRIAGSLRESWGNVSGTHQVSRSAKNLLEESREKCADELGVKPENIVFTSGGTESINIALQGFARAHPKSTIFYSALEHSAVSKPAKYLSSHGCETVCLPVNSSGILIENELENVQVGDLVCVIPVNNEIGVVNNIERIANIVHERGGFLLLDCVQSIYVYEPETLCKFADFAAYSSQKIGGPQGVGMLYINDRKSIEPLTFGGSQEWELRPGTTPVFLVDAFVYQLEIAIRNRSENIAHLKQCQNVCIEEIEKQIPGSKIHAIDAKRSPHIVSVDVGNLEAQMLVAMIDKEGVCVSRGSACASGAQTPSPVLLAMGIDEGDATSTLRLSFYSETKIDDVVKAVEIIAQCVSKLRESLKVGSK